MCVLVSQILVMAVLGLRLCHRSGPISNRRLFSAIMSSVDEGIGPDNTRRLPQTAHELEVMNWRRKFDDIFMGGRSRPLIDGQVIRRCPRIWDPNMKRHTDLLRMLGKAKVKSGAVLYSSTRDDDDLEFSLIDLGLFFLEERGYPNVSTRSPEGKSDLRVIGKDVDQWIPKAVLPFRAYPSDEGIRPSQLPIRYAGSSSLRLFASMDYDNPDMPDYQTWKLNQVCITGPTGDESSNMFEELLKNCEDFYGALGISYRVVAIRSVEFSRYFLEGWFPGSQTYQVLANLSRHTDCQLVDTQFGKRSSEHSGQHVHFLRSTFMVTEYTIASVLESLQREDGVEVPKLLGLYMGGKSFLPFRFKYAPPRGRRRHKKKSLY